MLRDVIWTIIIVWLIWKVIDIFKATTVVRIKSQDYSQKNDFQSKATESAAQKKSHLKPGAGEYVDFEESK